VERIEVGDADGLDDHDPEHYRNGRDREKRNPPPNPAKQKPLHQLEHCGVFGCLWSWWLWGGLVLTSVYGAVGFINQEADHGCQSL
jgi:hypothetical protein